MNSLYIVILSIAVFLLGYRFYARRLERLFGVDPQRKTPSETRFDGIDYVPAKHWTVLFGHHFASIAGAGPIIGPVIAVAVWGWGPALLWILLGTIFIGGVHDFGSLVLSVKHDGVSIGEAAQNLISHRARTIFAVFVWLSLILVVAVFAYLCGQTLASEPKIVIPSFGLIFIALLAGCLMYQLKWNQALVTVLGLGLLALLLVAGAELPLGFRPNVVFWSLILLVYSYIASVTPVQILLQPRDYLSSFLLVFGVVFGYLGLLISRPNINTPFLVAWNSSSGYLWPMMFVTIACGAISGFHCLIASGTSSKQIASEAHAKRIGYGGMVAEGIVAVMALLAVAAGISSRGELSGMLQKGGPGPIGAFGAGYGVLAKPLLAGYGGLVAMTILNAFILTTLDTATRIARYITQELFGIKNRFFATFIIVVLAGWLALSGKWNMIWPVFGASNQLVAALALLIISCWLLSRRQPTLYTLIPCLFMFITTTGALVYQLAMFLKGHNRPLAVITVALLCLALYMVFEVIKSVRTSS